VGVVLKEGPDVSVRLRLDVGLVAIVVVGLSPGGRYVLACGGGQEGRHRQRRQGGRGRQPRRARRARLATRLLVSTAPCKGGAGSSSAAWRLGSTASPAARWSGAA
jgi:hypothetical protein